MEHACAGGVQLSLGAEMEAYGDQATAACNQFCWSLGMSQTGNTVITNIEWHN